MTSVRVIWLTGPLARLSAMSAMVTVGEKLATTAARSPAAASFCRPTSAGAIPSHGHASQMNTNSPEYRSSRVIDPNRTIACICGRSLAKLISSPAMNAMSTTASPLISCSSRAIGVVMMLPT